MNLRKIFFYYFNLTQLFKKNYVYLCQIKGFICILRKK